MEFKTSKSRPLEETGQQFGNLLYKKCCIFVILAKQQIKLINKTYGMSLIYLTIN